MLTKVKFLISKCPVVNTWFGALRWSDTALGNYYLSFESLGRFRCWDALWNGAPNHGLDALFANPQERDQCYAAIRNQRYSTNACWYWADVDFDSSGLISNIGHGWSGVAPDLVSVDPNDPLYEIAQFFSVNAAWTLNYRNGMSPIQVQLAGDVKIADKVDDQPRDLLDLIPF
jgi:hypothetical protein